MEDRFGKFLATELADPRRFVRVPDVVLFDAHQERDPRTGKLDRDFTKGELEEVAHFANRRDRTGTLSPLTIGHTDPDDPDEDKQPEGVGYAKGYKVVWSPRHQKFVIATTFYVDAKHHARAKTFPRVSIELWPGKRDKKTNQWIEPPAIDPIALLRRCPRQNVGQWTYARGDAHAPAGLGKWRFARAGRRVLQYSLSNWAAPFKASKGTTNMAAKPQQYEMDEGAPETYEDAPAPEMEGAQDEGGGAPMEPAAPDHKSYAMHAAKCYAMLAAHPDHQAMMDASTAEEAPPEGAGAEPAAPPPDAPAGPPDEEPAPEMHNAFAGAPTPTNAGLPPKKFAKPGKPDVYAARLDALEAENRKLRKQQIDADSRRIVAQLVNDGFALKDPEGEVLRFSKMTSAARQDRDQWIRSNMTPAPVQAYGRIPVAHSNGSVPDVENDPESVPAGDMVAIERYQKQHGLWDASLGDLAALALPKKYAKSK